MRDGLVVGALRGQEPRQRELGVQRWLGSPPGASAGLVVSAARWIGRRGANQAVERDGRRLGRARARCHEIVIGRAERVGVEQHPARDRGSLPARPPRSAAATAGGRWRRSPRQARAAARHCRRCGWPKALARPGELERRAIVRLHRRAGRPSGQRRGPGRRTSTGRGTDRARRPTPGRRRRRAAARRSAIARQARLERLGRADEQHVAVADQPQRAVRKHRQKRGDDRLQVARADVVGVRPLAEHAARRQAIACAASKNSRVNSDAMPAIHGFDGSETMTS